MYGSAVSDREQSASTEAPPSPADVAAMAARLKMRGATDWAIVSPGAELLSIDDQVHHTLTGLGMIDGALLVLRSCDKQVDQEFNRFLREGRPGARFLLRPEAGSGWVVVRLQPRDLAEGSVRLLRFTFSSTRSDCGGNGVANFLKLTRTEIAVLDRYTCLYSPQAVAEEMGLSRETVRSHLKRIHAKAGIADGRELIRLVSAFDQVW